MGGLTVLSPGAGEDASEVALRSIERGVRTLVVGEGLRSFIPELPLVCTLRSTAFVAETPEYFEAVTSAIDDYSVFVLVGFAPNDFEVELFRQICDRLDKRILLVQRQMRPAD